LLLSGRRPVCADAGTSFALRQLASLTLTFGCLCVRKPLAGIFGNLLGSRFGCLCTVEFAADLSRRATRGFLLGKQH
jgi:hypothetical protein